MKALITAVALLSFVAASTVPLAAQAQTQTEQTKPAKAKKTTHKSASHKSTHKSAKNKSKSKKKSPAA